MTTTLEQMPEVSGLEVTISRLVNASPERIFEAWTTPEHLVRWWGPDGFTTTIKEFSLTPGGEWRLVMHGPDGTDYHNHIVFKEIERPARLVYRTSGKMGGNLDVSFITTVTFEAVNGKTKVTMLSRFESVDLLRAVVEKYGAIEGGKQHLARLENYITTNKKA